MHALQSFVPKVTMFLSTHMNQKTKRNNQSKHDMPLYLEVLSTPFFARETLTDVSPPLSRLTLRKILIKWAFGVGHAGHTCLTWIKATSSAARRVPQ